MKRIDRRPDPEGLPRASVPVRRSRRRCSALTMVDHGRVEPGPHGPREKLPVVVIDATHEKEWGGASPVLLEGTTCPRQPVAKPAQRLGDPELGDRGGERQNPAGVGVDLWHPAIRSAGQLSIEQLGETGRATPEVCHAVGDTTGFDTNRDDRRAGEGVDDHERIAAGRSSDGTELVSADENELSGDAAPDQPVGRPARRVGLVGEPDLHVLDIARDPRIRKSGRVCCIGGKVDDLR